MPQPSIFSGFNTASGMRSHVTGVAMDGCDVRLPRFNTASGMRSHVTWKLEHQTTVLYRFNTASGMRSHVTFVLSNRSVSPERFQYRKRYEVTCDKGKREAKKIDTRVSIPQAV